LIRVPPHDGGWLRHAPIVAAVALVAAAAPAIPALPDGFLSERALAGADEDSLAREGLRVRSFLVRELARSVVRIEGAPGGPVLGSFVSGDGLILTQARVADACSPPGSARDEAWPPEHGFLAATRSSERACPDLGLASELGGEIDGLVLRLVHVGAPALARFGGDAERGRWPRHAMPYAFLRATRRSPTAPTPRPPPAHEPSIHLAASFDGYRPRGLVVALTPRREQLVAFARVDGFASAAGAPRGPYATTLGTMTARLADADGYRVPGALEAQITGQRLEPLADRHLRDVVVNFATTLDAGREVDGAPLVDGQGRLVGMVYASSTDETGARRAIAVDVRGLVDLLVRGYGAVELATELGLGR
jgi:hypothetical protein